MSSTTRIIKLTTTHVIALGVGFALGIYLLPILTAPDSPDTALIQTAAENARFTGEFRRDLEDSDALHYGEGTLYVGPDTIVFEGRISPGPDFRLYLSPEFVETETAFEANKHKMVEVGPVRTFDNFMLPVPDSIEAADYSTAIVWCESFGQFISAAQYQE